MSTPSDPCRDGACPTCDGDQLSPATAGTVIGDSPALVHDRHCPVTASTSPCPVCAAIGAARGEEKQAFAAIWKANIPRLEDDWYARGYADGAAGRWRLR